MKSISLLLLILVFMVGVLWAETLENKLPTRDTGKNKRLKPIEDYLEGLNNWSVTETTDEKLVIEDKEENMFLNFLINNFLPSINVSIGVLPLQRLP